MTAQKGLPANARKILLGLLLLAATAALAPQWAGLALANAGAVRLNRALADGPEAATAATPWLSRALAWLPAAGQERSTYLLGLAWQAGGDVERAARAWRQAPAVAETLIAWGDNAWRAGTWALAGNWYGQAAIVAPTNAYAHYRAGLAAMRLGRPAEAAPALAQAWAALPEPRVGPSDILLQQAAVAVEAKTAPDWAPILATLDQAVALDDFRESAFNPAQAHYLRGEALRQLGRRDEAIAPYERVIAGWPEHYWAHYWLGRLLWEARGEVDRAETMLTTALALNPGQAAAYLELAQIYSATERPDEALALLADARARFPDHAGLRELEDALQEAGGGPVPAP